jgi:hypothetical protein
MNHLGFKETVGGRRILDKDNWWLTGAGLQEEVVCVQGEWDSEEKGSFLVLIVTSHLLQLLSSPYRGQS